MEAVSIKIGPVVFSYADYDSENDVLYLHVAAPESAEGIETPEGHVVRYAPDSDRIVGLTLMSPRLILEREGRLAVTIPETVEAPTESLAPILAAA
jgi:hypothetical protein